MPRPVILYSGSWADSPIEDLAGKAADWGYEGLELCCWGGHFDVHQAAADEGYCHERLDVLARSNLTVPVLSNHPVGQAVCDPVDVRHRRILPAHVWGDGRPEGVWQRAAAEMVDTVRAAQRLGAAVVGGFTGSPLWGAVTGWPPPEPVDLAAGFAEAARRWSSVLDACRDADVRFACEVHPGQLAFDFYSAEMLLDTFASRTELGFLFDPSHLHWQGVDPVEFIRRFADRIYHVHLKDATLTLSGRTGLLCSYLPAGDHRRGWDFRSPGHGGLDWEGIIRGLHEIGYDGPLSVEWKDSAMDRDYGADDACRFARRLDFEPARSDSTSAFRGV